MTRQTWNDDADENWDDEGDDVDDVPTIPCPYCGCEIHEDSPRCPSCENYLSLEDAPTTTTSKPWWVLLGAGLGLLAFLSWLFV